MTNNIKVKNILNEHNIVDALQNGNDVILYSDNGNFVYSFKSQKIAKEITKTIHTFIDPIPEYLKGI